MQDLIGLIEGRIVHYCLAAEDVPIRWLYAGEHRAAIICRTWDEESYSIPGVVNLLVFCDGLNDGHPSNMLWKTSVHHSDAHEPGTWHWIEGSPAEKRAVHIDVTLPSAVGSLDTAAAERVIVALSGAFAM